MDPTETRDFTFYLRESTEGWDSSEGNQEKKKKAHLCSLIYYKYSTSASIRPLPMPSSGKLLHAFASVRDCQCEVSTCRLFLWEDMWIYVNICVSPLQCALPLPAYISRGPNSYLSLSAWWNISERSCSGFSAVSDFSAIKTRVLPPAHLISEYRNSKSKTKQNATNLSQVLIFLEVQPHFEAGLPKGQKASPMLTRTHKLLKSLNLRINSAAWLP